MEIDGLDFSLRGTRHIAALAWYLNEAAARSRPAEPGVVMAAYAEELGLKKDSVYKACFYALRAAGLPHSVMGAVRYFAALAALEGLVYRG